MHCSQRGETIIVGDKENHKNTVYYYILINTQAFIYEVSFPCMIQTNYLNTYANNVIFSCFV